MLRVSRIIGPISLARSSLLQRLYNPFNTSHTRYMSDFYPKYLEQKDNLYKNRQPDFFDLPESKIKTHHYDINKKEKENNKKLQEPKKVVHYKGGEYMFLGEGIHTETEEELVFYYGASDLKMYARPKTMFHDYLDYNGKNVKRFIFVNDDYDK